MRSILTIAAAGALAIAALAPAAAATHHKRAAPAPSDYTDQQSAPAAWRAEQMPPVANWHQPPGCVVDEGYGRFSPCDEGGY